MRKAHRWRYSFAKFHAMPVLELSCSNHVLQRFHFISRAPFTREPSWSSVFGLPRVLLWIFIDFLEPFPWKRKKKEKTTSASPKPHPSKPHPCNMPHAKTEVALQFSESCAAEIALQYSLICTKAALQQNQQLHCNIEKVALQESGIFLPLSCGFHAPMFRLPRLLRMSEGGGGLSLRGG